MKLSIIDTGFFKLDGGAMFGVVPRRMWQKLNPPDENNMCTWAMRCLLIEVADKKILVDAGIGEKQNEKFRSHFEPHGNDNLIQSLQNNGVNPEDITDVLLTHLHFDHVGGAVKLDEKGQAVPTFPNATYWTNERHYNWAMHPNARERASYLKENFVPLMDAGVLKFIDVQDNQWNDWIGDLKVYLVHGHTEAMMMLSIPTQNHHFVYCADLIPASYHINLPYVMAYDLRPLVTMQEKERFLKEAIAKDYVVIFEHDPRLAYAKIALNDRGRYTKVALEIEELSA